MRNRDIHALLGTLVVRKAGAEREDVGELLMRQRSLPSTGLLSVGAQVGRGPFFSGRNVQEEVLAGGCWSLIGWRLVLVLLTSVDVELGSEDGACALCGDAPCTKPSPKHGEARGEARYGRYLRLGQLLSAVVPHPAGGSPGRKRLLFSTWICVVL